MNESVGNINRPHNNKRNAAIGLAGIAALLGWSVFAGSDQAAAYTCDNMVPEVLAMSETNQSALLPVKVLDIVERQMLVDNDTRVACRGVAILSSGDKASVNYRAYIEYDKWWVKYETTGIL